MAVSPPDIGQSRQRVTVEEPIETRNAGGESVQSWTATSARWATVVPTGSIEESFGGGIRALATYTVRMRYWPGLKPTARLSWQGRTFELTSIIDVGLRHYEYEIQAREVVET